MFQGRSLCAFFVNVRDSTYYAYVYLCVLLVKFVILLLFPASFMGKNDVMCCLPCDNEGLVSVS
jgi:hypothetical protein